MNKLFTDKALSIVNCAESKIKDAFINIEEISFYNQQKVLNAFIEHSVALRHFSGTSGYGYDDIGRDTLNKVFATAFEAEDALVSSHILSGTHALTAGLFGILRPNDLALSITGKPYDTLTEVIEGKDGCLKDFLISFDYINLTNDGEIDTDKVMAYLSKTVVKMVFIQRSRGYSWRRALSVAKIGAAISRIKGAFPNIIVFVDNCYGEFVEKSEPTLVGADVIVGSLIKNPGGGLAPTGGYFAGKKQYIDLIAARVTSPSVGNEIGSNMFGYQYYYQGFFMSPHTVSQAIKGSVLIGQAMQDLGYETCPSPNEPCYDIIRSVKFNKEEELIHFIQAIQKASPIDSNLTAEPWEMPGYTSKVIMAAGCFIQGASLELSADSPIIAPYIAYVQGGVTYEHVKIAICKVIDGILGEQK